ncbi:uncharacterized protein [Apostichopus japonicus]|uniref:uncharacterized protein n=1 Tax=Stichopus japonicus TaxID=307972 RepID=UPI003AB51087
MIWSVDIYRRERLDCHSLSFKRKSVIVFRLLFAIMSGTVPVPAETSSTTHGGHQTHEDGDKSQRHPSEQLSHEGWAEFLGKMADEIDRKTAQSLATIYQFSTAEIEEEMRPGYVFTRMVVTKGHITPSDISSLLENLRKVGGKGHESKIEDHFQRAMKSSTTVERRDDYGELKVNLIKRLDRATHTTQILAIYFDIPPWTLGQLQKDPSPGCVLVTYLEEIRVMSKENSKEVITALENIGATDILKETFEQDLRSEDGNLQGETDERNPNVTSTVQIEDPHSVASTQKTIINSVNSSINSGITITEQSPKFEILQSRPKEDTCVCNTGDSRRFRKYYLNKSVVGAICKTCGKEWLQKMFLRDLATTREISVDGQPLCLRRCSINISESLPSENDGDCSTFKVGDLIKWKSDEHHQNLNAIIESIDTDENVSLIVIEASHFGQIKIYREDNCLSKFNDLHAITYERNGEVPDLPDLVRARALAWCTGDSYISNIFLTETMRFIKYCKFGSDLQWRVMGHVGEVVTNALKNTLGSTWVTGREEKDPFSSDRKYFAPDVHSGIYIIIADSAFTFQLNERDTHTTTEQNLFRSFCTNFSKCLSYHNFLVYEMLSERPWAEENWYVKLRLTDMVVPILIKSIEQETQSPRTSFNPLASVVGHAIHLTMKKTDEEVQLNELLPGDHIVTSHTTLHPRCHAIVASVNLQMGQLGLIRNVFPGRIVERVEKVSPPILRVVYNKSDICSPDEVIQKARSEHARKKHLYYNILTNNCKHFAVWCKRKTDETSKSRSESNESP